VSELVRVYVNERPVEVPAGAPALAAVATLDGDLGTAVSDGRAYLTDGRGIRLAADLPLAAGAIVRVVRSARSGPKASDDGDADT
jgi:hypothetical protein